MVQLSEFFKRYVPEIGSSFPEENPFVLPYDTPYLPWDYYSFWHLPRLIISNSFGGSTTCQLEIFVRSWVTWRTGRFVSAMIINFITTKQSLFAFLHPTRSWRSPTSSAWGKHHHQNHLLSWWRLIDWLYNKERHPPPTSTQHRFVLGRLSTFVPCWSSRHQSLFAGRHSLKDICLNAEFGWCKSF